MTEYGRFLAAVKGPVSGNVLLRRQQYRKADDPHITKGVASNIIMAKVANVELCSQMLIPFLGSGSSLIAAKELNLNAFG